MPLLSGTQRNRGRPRPSIPSQRQQDRRAAELPEYEPPSFPLDKAFHRELAGLSNDADTRKYEEQLKQSIKLLTDNVRDINDRHVRRKEELANLKRKRQSQGGENEGEDGDARKRQQAEEEAVLRLREAVPALTTECDNAVRHIIDLRVQLEDGRKAIQDTVQKAEAEGANAAARGGEGEEDDDGDYVMRKPDTFRGPLQIWKDEQEKAAADYATRSLEQRYAVDNDYIGFKRLWWDAAHGVDGKPLPDASKWFSRNNGDEDEDEEDDDLVIAKEHIDILCPLSMVVMDKPYTSNICKHTFNKPAIMQFLRAQPGQKAKCPQTGCSKVWLHFIITLMNITLTLSRMLTIFARNPPSRTFMTIKLCYGRLNAPKPRRKGRGWTATTTMMMRIE